MARGRALGAKMEVREAMALVVAAAVKVAGTARRAAADVVVEAEWAACSVAVAVVAWVAVAAAWAR